MSADRWLGVGHSTDDPRVAVTDAISGSDPQLLVVFWSGAVDADDVVEAIRGVAPGVAAIGCRTAGTIPHVDPDPESDAPSVVVTAFGGDGFSATVGSADIAEHGSFLAGSAAASGAVASAPSEGTSQALLVIADGAAGEQSDVVRGAFSVVGRSMPIVGGSTGGFDGEVLQLCGDRILRGAVVAAALRSTGTMGLGVSHGLTRTEPAMLVTRSDGAVIWELDGEPAAERYLAAVGGGAELSDAEVDDLANQSPLGLHRDATVKEQLRYVEHVDRQAGTVHCVAEVPEGSLVSPMTGSVADVMAGAVDACALSREQLDADPIGGLVFDCVGRRALFGPAGTAEEFEIFADRLGAPLGGFYTVGEIAKDGIWQGFHNQTAVVLAVS